MRKATAQRAAAIYKERFEDQDSSTLPATFQARNCRSRECLLMSVWNPHECSAPSLKNVNVCSPKLA
jgi:hypothetical protein